MKNEVCVVSLRYFQDVHCIDFLYFFSQGLKSALPSQPPTMIFASPTKLLSESGSAAEYMGSNKVPELQKFFQVFQI